MNWLATVYFDALGTLAQATTNPASTRPTGGGWGEIFRTPMFPILLLILVFYVFMFRNKRNQDRQRTDMLSQMKRGDRVQTIGGILGKVVDAEEHKVLLKVDESSNTKIWFSRNAIHRVLEEDAGNVKAK